MNEEKIFMESYPKNSKVGIKVDLDEAHSPFKVLAYPEMLKKYQSGEKINPIHIRVGLTNSCNIRCKFCNFHSENEKEFYDAFDFKDSLKTEEVIEFMKCFYKDGGRAVTFCGSGEPTIHPGYIDICNELHSIVMKIGVITNGTQLNNYDLLRCIAETHTWIRIGLNAGKAETYANITKGSQKSMRYILDAVRFLKENTEYEDFKIGLNFVITLDNCHEIVDATKLAYSAGADYIRFEPEFYTEMAHRTIYEEIDYIVDALNQAKEYENNVFEVSIPKMDRGPMTKTDKVEGDFVKCHYSEFVTALGADGCMYPCPQIHMGSKYQMGNPIRVGYNEWKCSGEREKWKEEHADRREYCKTCFYRPQNELLERIKEQECNVDELVSKYRKKHPDILHKEFV